MVLKTKTLRSLIETRKINYKNLKLLRSFVTAQGKIIPRHTNCVTAQQQKKITKAIKRARILGLFTFINSNSI